MSVSLRRERDNVYRLEVTGLLRERDFAEVQRIAAAEIRKNGNMRLLVVLDQFDGWEQGVEWRDLNFYVRYGDDIDRIAFVGDARWRSEAVMFVGADLRKAKVAYFRPSDADRAGVWLSE